MSLLAGKAQLALEPKMAAALDAVAETATPANFKPTLGPIAQLAYKPARCRYLVRTSGTDGSGSADLIVYQGAAALATVSLDLSQALIDGVVELDLTTVGGTAPLSVALDVTGADLADSTATVDAVIEIDYPLTVI